MPKGIAYSRLEALASRAPRRQVAPHGSCHRRLGTAVKRGLLWARRNSTSQDPRAYLLSGGECVRRRYDDLARVRAMDGTLNRLLHRFASGCGEGASPVVEGHRR